MANDPSGAVVPGAEVPISSRASGEVRKAQSGARRGYLVSGAAITDNSTRMIITFDEPVQFHSSPASYPCPCCENEVRPGFLDLRANSIYYYW